MQPFCADLHIHSRFSRATSKQLSLQNLAAWAGLKGVDILTTGDFTHPGWMAEIEENLVQEDTGLLRLNDPEGLTKEIPWFPGQSLPVSTRFILGTEISSIYKRDGLVRKIHNLVFMPNLEKAQKFNQRLAQIGNLASDGRPILGLDARDLLEMVLEIDELAFLIPAHIWTPWFSLFGSKSGFNSLEECFADLSDEIFALETGLSSDPAMNWLWSQLDQYVLVSNSDAHSGANLAREANLFLGQTSYETIYKALKKPDQNTKFMGTIEFFPEEGKYHLDGHRKCKVVIDPRDKENLTATCPVCGHPLTIGVFNRILRLADRSEPRQPPKAPDYDSLIPLPEILAEILGRGSKTKTVTRTYGQLLELFGSELSILQNIPVQEIHTYSPIIAEAIRRMRQKKVIRQPGFDGQYGRISVFTDKEQKEIQHGQRMIPISKKGKYTKSSQSKYAGPYISEPQTENNHSQTTPIWNTEQKKAIKSKKTPLLVIAGPGTGKTRTLLGRAQFLIAQNIPIEEILIVTFTRDAAREVKERLDQLFEHKDNLLRVDTLHALAYKHCLNRGQTQPLLLTEEEARLLFARCNPKLDKETAKRYWEELSLARERQESITEKSAYIKRYKDHKDKHNFLDYTDLLEIWSNDLSSQAFDCQYSHVLVDEVQDLSSLQMDLLRKITPQKGKGFFAIGDPAQSIYSFRGALTNISYTLEKFWEDLTILHLHQNYRSRQNILDFSQSLFPDNSHLKSIGENNGSLTFYYCQTGQQESRWITGQIKRLLGGTSHLEADQEKTGCLGPGDIAILARFKALLHPIKKSLTEQGIPCTLPEERGFWHEPRIALILKTVSWQLGLTEYCEEQLIDCPKEIILKGPSKLTEHLRDNPYFDSLFWESKAFKELQRKYNSYGNWKDLLNWIRLEEDMFQLREKAQKIRLMTLHAAKGLEFEAVFLPGLEEGILPFAGRHLFDSNKLPPAITTDREEEKRLFYVGLTRAKQQLFLSQACSRNIYGRKYYFPASSFLSILPLDRAKRIQNRPQTIKREKQLRFF